MPTYEYVKTKFLQKEMTEKMRRDIAKKITKTQHLKPGICNLCGRNFHHKTEGLLQTILTVCRPCAKTFARRTGLVKMLKRELTSKGYYCDYCWSKTYIKHQLNVQVCDYCLNKIGRRHKIWNKYLTKEKFSLIKS